MSCFVRFVRRQIDRKRPFRSLARTRPQGPGTRNGRRQTSQVNSRIAEATTGQAKFGLASKQGFGTDTKAGPERPLVLSRDTFWDCGDPDFKALRFRPKAYPLRDSLPHGRKSSVGDRRISYGPFVTRLSFVGGMVRRAFSRCPSEKRVVHHSLICS